MKRALSVLGLVALVACSGVDEAAVSTVNCGDFNTFEPVSNVLEQRCGTIDCHGTFSRPLRIYSRTGLRRPEEKKDFVGEDYAQYFPGGTEEVTQRELLDNFRSVCGLEPELTTRVVKGELEPTELTLVRKQRLIEKHKGGKIFNPNREGDLCIVSWLTGKPDPAPCNLEIAHD